MPYTAYKNPNLGFTTRQLHAGYDPSQHHDAKNVPIYQTAAFEFGSFARSERLCLREEPGDACYSRCANPTNQALEDRIASLDGGTAGLSFGSGMGAISATLLNLVQAGDEIVTVPTMYGDSLTLIKDVLPEYGVVGRVVANPDDIDSYAAVINEHTKAIYVEVLGNPLLNVIDFEAVADLAHAHGIPLVVDNTFATPYLFRPFEHGADIDVYSATKYLSGHGTVVAGLVTERGDFDWFNGRFPQIERFYHESKDLYAPERIEHQLFTRRLYERSLGLFGAHLSAQSVFLTLQGIETLSLRMERHASNAQRVAEFLAADPAVLRVDFPGLPDSPYYDLARRYFPRGITGMLSFRVRGGRDAAARFLDAIQIFDHMVNLGDAKSYAVYPSLATHLGLSADEQERAGIFPDTIRLSVGIEDIDDLLWDLDQALRAAERG